MLTSTYPGEEHTKAHIRVRLHPSRHHKRVFSGQWRDLSGFRITSSDEA